MAAARGAAVAFRGFGWRYASRRRWAIRDLDLTIRYGERVLLLGPSGAGKSTLLLAAAGLLSADSGDRAGSVEVSGRPSEAARDDVGLVFQDPDSQLVMSRLGDDIAFGLENLEVARDRIWPRVDEALATVGLRYGRAHATDRLSGGEKQRLALAGTIVRRPRVLLLDEPTANLDPDGAYRLRGAVHDRLRDTDATMVLVEHRIEDWLPFVDRVVVLDETGGVAADGEPAGVLGSHGDRLAADGVWVPGFTPPERHAARPPGERLLSAECVHFAYPATGADAVAGVDLDLHAGAAVAVVGANGSGKSTLALLFGGLLAPTAGSVRDRAGRPLIGLPARRLVTVVGSVFQQPEHQFLTGRVRDELTLGPYRAGVDKRELVRRVDELLERLRLGPLAEANPYTLSGGEKRRLSVATALAAWPRALVLDEPTFGQDMRTWQELVALLAGIRDAGTALLMVTHDRPFARALSDRTLSMADGVASEELGAMTPSYSDASTGTGS